MTMVKPRDVISSFISKLDLYKRNIGRRALEQFPSLQEQTGVSNESMLKYCDHLVELKLEMERRFEDIIQLEIPDWVTNPFTANTEEAEISLQEELIDLQNDTQAKNVFKTEGYQKMWATILNRYPGLWTAAKLLILSFPSSYLVERGFSAVVKLLTKDRNRLGICQRGDLRLYLTDVLPDICSLAKKHEPQGSH